MRTNNRSAAIDAVRIIGIVAVIVGHVWETEMFQRLIYSWQVPVFFVLTGYFWTARRSVSEEVRKRSLTLLRPYLFWLTTIGLLFLARSVSESGTSRLASDVFQIVLGGSYAVRPFTAFWFATALFFGAVGLRCMQRLPMWGQWSAATVILAAAYLAPAFFKGIPLAAGTGLACVVFVLAGVAFRAVRNRIRAGAIVGVAMIAVGLLLSGFGMTASLSLKNAQFGTPVASVLIAVAVSVGMVLVAEATIPLLSDRAQSAITTVAVCGLMVVLTHPVILWVLSTPPTGSWTAFALSVTVPWLTGLILLFTPLSPWALGVARRERSQLGFAAR
ncbi:hypothetical protein CH260_02590 [Rhodococcus sp. 05-2256-B2]|uniref:acyltransferase family protein n=1 Tax=unclassified Rhodococcus (in: high G+C Gram-positive bacteria) TaxID=192944 RepID=UPI000B9BC5A3|nr:MULTISPECIES: acyltransferase family protein [unclassified Rhodococcus (in: high G+C Gram-positive bacteria)]OZD78712.1 hypothetical protein CH258_22120 [Rhodococcus sp. 05-2256-B4]OZD93813.1 hypothetical protein CH257_09995 [Rhodococcus sp. 05-2256-B3]OZE00912.1 hypothetical protein CH260_02590 [Rhodococcus sp. 05-2256-B2]OZE04516.1 hypothetical protein CH285_08750 [Rhodococcus sp. 05-2256-B1]